MISVGSGPVPLSIFYVGNLCPLTTKLPMQLFHSCVKDGDLRRAVLYEHHVTLVRHPGCYPGFILTKSPPFLPFGEYNSPSGIYYVYQLHLLR